MYKIIIKKKAKKFVDKLPKNERFRIASEIKRLPEGDDIRPLKGQKNAGLLRLLVGDYRIIYSVDHGILTVFVIDAGNRGDIYKSY